VPLPARAIDPPADVSPCTETFRFRRRHTGDAQARRVERNRRRMATGKSQISAPMCRHIHYLRSGFVQANWPLFQQHRDAQQRTLASPSSILAATVVMPMTI